MANAVVVEEKLDGANLGFVPDKRRSIRIQNRGGWLTRSNSGPQFKPLWAWLALHSETLVGALWPDLTLFGEWCYARHTIAYSRLPDWFLAFDVYDGRVHRFWSTARRDSLLRDLRIAQVPRIASGRFTLASLIKLLGSSQLADERMEGLVVRHDDGDWLASRAKLVRPEFVQGMDEHWTQQPLEPNHLTGRTAWS